MGLEIPVQGPSALTHREFVRGFLVLTIQMGEHQVRRP
jgi:hypothetical protein